MKISIVGIPARDKVLKGATYIADAVRSTIGPFGLNALMEKGGKVTNDGYTISAALIETVKNEFEREGAKRIHEASSKTNDQVGDATSTAEVLAIEITKEAMRYLPHEKSLTSKKTPAEVKRMINEAKEQVLTKLEESVVKIESKEELVKSALVSVEDEDIAELLGNTQWELGADGIIVAEEVNDIKSSIEKVKGIRLDNGFSATYMVTNPEKGTLEISNMPIMMTNYTIGVEEMAKLKDRVITPLLNKKQPGMVIIARAFTPDAIKLCGETSNAGFVICPINAPYTDQAEIMRDIETVVGGRYIDTEESNLDDIFITDIGFCKRLVAGRWDSIVTGVDDEHSEERIAKRIEVLKKKLEGEQSDFGKKMIEGRLAQLTNGFAILKVGAVSLIERKRLKDKCDDAVNAVRLALKGGTVKGAGLAFKEISDSLDETNILKRPLTAINDQIMSSAPEGFEVEDWVRDPFLVLKSALTNACDVASALATTNIVIATENPKDCKCHGNSGE